MRTQLDQLRIYRDGKSLPYGVIMDIYSREMTERAREEYPGLPLCEAIHEAQQDFYSYLTADFFSEKGVFIAILSDKAALRMELYGDGYLLSGLTTAPEYRRRGFAQALLEHCTSLLPKGSAVYCHVHKQNLPSLAFHRQYGFETYSHSAVLLDGTFSNAYVTLRYFTPV